ncbi:unnamed protein product [Camellia sinensis]
MFGGEDQRVATLFGRDHRSLDQLESQTGIG